MPSIPADREAGDDGASGSEDWQADDAGREVRRWQVPNTQPALVLIRHGETEWSRSGQHTGRTDIALTEFGEQQAQAAGPLIRGVLGSNKPALVLSSPRQRAWRTAELAGFSVDEIVEDAAEWDYGDLEGLTSPEIRKRWPDWSIWSGPIPGGEDAAAVTARFDRLMRLIADRYESERLSGPVLIFSHGHAIRCLAARWLGDPVNCGRRFWLGTGAVSSLGYEHGSPVVLRWNVDSALSAEVSNGSEAANGSDASHAPDGR